MKYCFNNVSFINHAILLFACHPHLFKAVSLVFIQSFFTLFLSHTLTMSPSKITTFFTCCTTQTCTLLNYVTFPWAWPLFWCLSCQQLLITLHPTDGCLQICIQAVTILERFNKYLFSYRWMVSPTWCFLWGVIFIAAHIQKSGGIFFCVNVQSKSLETKYLANIANLHCP